jgi:phosphoribosylaminoimidazole-succinocarboxamide synthase
MTPATPTALPGWRHLSSGKVRDLYEPDGDGGGDRLLMVASDRISAFDRVLANEVPGKGRLLTELTWWWFGQLPEVPNQTLPLEPPAVVAGRAMVVKRLSMFPVECVVRGYLVGSGWVEYRETGAVSGVRLPAGLAEGDRLPEPIFTPASKAAVGDHDENIDLERMRGIVGDDAADRLRELSLDLFAHAGAVAEARGLILADTKFEFGRDADGVITLADEVLTPDSSRYWSAERYAAGGEDRLASYDKQIVRDWLRANWDRRPRSDGAEPAPPALPEEVVQRTSARYRKLYERLTDATAPRA